MDLDQEACHITKKLYEYKSRLGELDFDYIFYDKDNRQSTLPKID